MVTAVMSFYILLSSNAILQKNELDLDFAIGGEMLSIEGVMIGFLATFVFLSDRPRACRRGRAPERTIVTVLPASENMSLSQ